MVDAAKRSRLENMVVLPVREVDRANWYIFAK
jgi:hypothetical protein